MADIKKLLEEIKALNIKQEAIEKATGGHFNIFEITNMSHKEVHICQVVKELIDPRGSHCQGDVYLRLFIEHVLKLQDEFSDELYSKTVVTAEHLIDENRRIDIYIKAGKKFAIPIEAKIWAGDQYAQCHDYYEYAKAEGAEKVALYYLTCDGHMPSEDSTKGMTLKEIEEIRLITFRDEIICWLEECLKLEMTAKIPSIREIIIQLTDALRRLTGHGYNEIETEIRKMINNREMFKSASQLSDAVAEIKEGLEKKFYITLDKKISERYGITRVKNKYDFEKVSLKSKGYQGICYNLGRIPRKKYNLGLRITIANFPYAEFCLLDFYEEICWDDFTKHVSQEDVLIKKAEVDTWSIGWKYLIENEDARPNFTYHNDAYFALIEEDHFNSTLEEMLEDLDAFLKMLKPEFSII